MEGGDGPQTKEGERGLAGLVTHADICELEDSLV